MSVTLDANVLLYASDQLSPQRDRALTLIERLAAGPEILYLFWPVVMAYLRIGTHPGVFQRPLSPEDARAGIADLLGRPHVRAPGEAEGFWATFAAVTSTAGPVRGQLVTDAHIAALMRQHGVTTIWTRDRDFRRFEGITARDPFA